MQKNPSYFLIQKEKRLLSVKELFSFLFEKIQPGQVTVCGEILYFMELPEFVTEKEQGTFTRLKNNLYKSIVNKKMKRLLQLTTEEMSLSVVEACLLEFLKKECAFRKSTKVLIADKSHVDLKKLLMPYCDNINYLQLFVEESQDYEYLAEEMYEESGLAVTFAAPGEEKYHIVIDLRNDFVIASENLAEGCVYFDGFSGQEKESRLRRERMGVTYISPMIYLDRALKNTL